MAAYAAHITPTKVLISQPLKTKQNQKRAQKSIPFRKWRFRGGKVKRMGQNQERIRQKEYQNKAEKQKGRYIYIEKWDQTESPEIPDRREKSDLLN